MKKFILRFSVAIFAFVSFGLSASAQNRAGTFAITNARIVTVSGATIENGTVVIQNGKIAAVGANVSVPSGAETIDAKGLSVYPGMIDAGTNLGLLEIPTGVPGTVDVAEGGEMNANSKAILGINPHITHINVTRVNGITTVMSYPAGGVISGQSAVINLNGSTQAEMALIPTFGLVINFPRITTFSGFNPFARAQPVDFNEAVRQRDKRLEDLKTIFKNSENYAKVQEAYAKDKTLPYPAQILGLSDRIGSIENGKIVNLVVTDGDILESRTNVKYLFIGGRMLPLTSRHTELFEQFKDRK